MTVVASVALPRWQHRLDPRLYVCIYPQWRSALLQREWQIQLLNLKPSRGVINQALMTSSLPAVGVQWSSELCYSNCMTLRLT